MAIMDFRDELVTGLAGLRTCDADPQRVELIRVRCLAALEAQRRRERSRRPHLADWQRRLELSAVFGLSALYLAVAIASSLALLR